jgi:iron complex outermembrane receptor protein/hemoglobin/transferrin/lactoferrin receptor protein
VTHTFSQDAAGEIEPFGQYDQKPFGTASTDSYTLTDIEAGFHYKSIGFLIAVDNIFDEEYRNFLDTYKGYALGRGRNVRLNVEWEF